TFIEIYQQMRERLVKWKPLQGSKFLSIATVMALSFRKINNREECVRLFCLISFFDSDNIPEFLLVADPRLQDEMLRQVFSNPESWNVCETINRHAFVCIEYCERYGVATYETCSLYSSIGIYEGHHGSYKSAERLFMKSLLGAEQIFGEDHINTADTINNLGNT